MNEYVILRRNGFDFLHKPGPTVHQYADGLGLLVLTAPLTSVSLCGIAQAVFATTK